VTNAALIAADIVEFSDALPGDELTHPLLACGGLCVLGRHTVVEDDRHLVPDPRLWLKAAALVHLVELIEHKRCVLVRHGQVDMGFHHIARPDHFPPLARARILSTIVMPIGASASFPPSMRRVLH